MKKKLITPRLLLLSSSVVACQGGVQAVRGRERLPKELLYETMQGVHELYTLENLMLTSYPAIEHYVREKYTKGQEYYNLVEHYVNRYNHINTLDHENWPNNTDAKHLRAAAEVLANNNTITRIFLPTKHIGDAGAKALAKALEKNNTITFIDLSFNNIGSSGAATLAKALEKNNTITKIYLYGNNIGDEGAKALAEALEKNKTITEIDLGGNYIGVKTIKRLSALCVRRNILLVSGQR